MGSEHVQLLQALEQNRAHAEYMEALVYVGQGLTRAKDIQTQLNLAWEFTRQRLQVSTFFIALYDHQANTLRFPLAYENDEPITIPERLLRDDETKTWGISGYVIKSKKELHWSTLQERQDLCQARKIAPIQMGEQPQQQACFYLPLISGEVVHGVISIQSYVAQAFSPILLNAFRTLGSQLSVSLENAQLFQAEAQRRAEAEASQRQAQLAQNQLRAFYEANSALVSSQDTEQILTNIVHRACVAAHAYGVSLILIDKTNTIKKIITAGADHGDDLQRIIRKDGLSMQVMTTGRHIAMENIRQETRSVNQTMAQRGILAALCLPVTLEGERIGIMWVHYDKPRSFSTSEIEAIQLYVNQAALAYDSARRIKALEHMRQAAEALGGVTDLQKVLAQIVRSAREVFHASSTALWSYDHVRRHFILDQSVSSGIAPSPWQAFLDQSAHPGQITHTILEQGWVGVSDISDTEKYNFLGEITRHQLGKINVRSFQGITLAVGDEKLGVLYVNYPYNHIFTQEEQQIARTFANHAALALKKARLLEQVSRARNAAQAVAEVSTLGELPQTLEAIVESTMKALSCDAVCLYTYDENRQGFDFPPTFLGVQNEALLLTPDYVKPTSVVWNILQCDHTHEAEASQHDPLLQGPFVRTENIQSSAGIPLTAGNRKVGVLFVNYRTPHRFTSEELSNIKLLADQAAIAIRNAQLYEETIRRANILEASHKAGEIVTKSLSLDEILEHIVEQAWIAVGHNGNGARFCDIKLVESGQLKSKALYPPNYISEMSTPPWDIDFYGRNKPRGITGKAVWTGTSQLVNDVTQEPDYVNFDPQTHSELAVPIKIEGKVYGVINVEHSDYHAFSEETQLALELLAAQAANAVQNARSYAVLRELYEANQAATSSLALNEILEQLVKNAWNGITHYNKRAIFCGFTLVEENRLKLHAVYPPKRWGELRTELGEINALDFDISVGITGRVVTTGETQCVGDVTQDPDYLEIDSETRSELAAPVKIEGRVIGVINIEHPDRNAFDKNDRDYLEALAAQASGAIKNARLYNVLLTLYEAGTAVSKSLDLDHILASLAKHAWELIGHYGKRVRFCALHLVKNGKLKLIVVYPPEHRSELQTKWKDTNLLDFDTSLGVTGKAVTTGETQLLRDVSQDADYLPIDPQTRSELAVPIKVNDQVIGVINVEHANCDAFSQDDRHNLEALAIQAAIAIQNARLYESARHRAEVQKALYEAGNAITQSLTLEDILQRIAVQAWKLISHDKDEARFCELCLIEGETLKHLTIYPPERQLESRWKLGNIDLHQYNLSFGITGRAARTGRTQRVDEVALDPDYLKSDLKTRSELAVPISLENQIIGVINIEHPDSKAFTADDQANIESLAIQAAIAIQNSQLYTKATRRAHVLQSLYEAGKAVTSSLSRDEVLDHITEQAWKLTSTAGDESCFSILALVENEGTKLRSISSYPQGHLSGIQNALGNVDLEQDAKIGVMGRAVKTRTPQLVDDVTQDADYINYDDKTRAELAVPILGLDGSPIGMINVEHPAAGKFTRDDLEALEHLADQAAIAIQNAQTYEALDQAKGMLGTLTAVTWMNLASSIWLHTIHKHAVTIRAQAELLRMDLQYAPPHPQLRALTQRIDRMIRLATEILKKPIAPPLSRKEGATSISINAFVSERAQQLWHNAKYQNAELDVILDLPESAEVWGSREWLREAFDLLVDNAVEAMEDSTIRQITIKTRRSKDDVEILIQDTGPGIPKEILPKIGLDTIRKPKDTEGLGKGLILAQLIVQAYGGRVYVDSTGPAGTTLVIALPLRR